MDEYKNIPEKENENSIPIVDDTPDEATVEINAERVFESNSEIKEDASFSVREGASEAFKSAQTEAVDDKMSSGAEEPRAFENSEAENEEPQAQTPSYTPRTTAQPGAGGVKTTYVPNASGMPRNNYGGYSAYSNNTQRNYNPYTGAPNNPSVPPKSEPKPKPKPKQNAKFSNTLTVIISVSVSLLLCLAIMWGGIASINVDEDGNIKLFGITVSNIEDDDDRIDESNENTSLEVTDSEYDAMDYERSEPDGSITTAVDNAAYSVVEISTEVVSTSFFYGEYIQSGAGSGVIIDAENGYIITCAHVISGASTVTVTLRDGKTYGAEIVGSDSQTDIAVIRIEAEGLVEATVADSDKLVVGQTAIAIGNPLGTLGGTVSSGIVSALDREITIDGQEYSLLQIDTSINPGNSGGGLFDITGSLIGIVNAKSGGSDSTTTIEGLGFAIPVNDALEVAADLIDQGYVGGRAYLGVQVYEYDGTQSNIDYSLYEYIYAGGYGVYFKEYQSGQKGDLLFGDKIIALDGNEVSTRNEILSILADYSVGDTVTLTVSRLNSDMGRRQMVDVEVTLIEGVPTEE